MIDVVKLIVKIMPLLDEYLTSCDVQQGRKVHSFGVRRKRQAWIFNLILKL